ncbi:DUF5693 family protein [Acetivibrio cellulolyticus]|uniref:DUF5693 family protein n=1 Tax=Acetivibrio cellulolyticus TaxID=35830 RepID=UPI0001E2DE0F|nr:DUF5693 family protein [Acetivibrio cellulolyticus]
MRKVLWLVLIVSTIFLVPLISLRLSNEINNNSVILACDYQKFISNNKLSNQLNFGDLREYNISSVILNEESLGSNSDRLNTVLCEKVNSYGLQIILNLNSLSHSKSYYKSLESIIQKYGIRYLLLYNSIKENPYPVNQNSYEDIEELRLLVIRNNLIFFVMENEEQTGYIPIPGLDSLITGTNYSLNRAFTISNYPSKVATPQDASLMWFRAVMDRNVRLVCIEPIYNSKDFTSDNRVLEVSKELSERLTERGFSMDTPINKVNPTIPGIPYSIPIIINLIASIALFINYIGIKKPCITIFSIILPSLAGFLIFEFIKPETNIWTAFAAAIIYPSLSSIILMNSLKNPSKNIFICICKSLLRLFFINGIGICTVIASMCDVRYTMHLINFNMVIQAFVIPLIVFNINFIFISQDQYPVYQRIINDIKRTGIKKFIFSNLVYILSISVLIYIYLLRSGNFNILPESAMELELRKFLELTMSARPRTKEFIIGYPCLFAFLYLYPKKVSYKLLSFLGTFSSIIGISIINSFCHGFTPVLTSLNRTFNGLLLGILTGCVSLIACSSLLKVKAIFSKEQ